MAVVEGVVIVSVQVWRVPARVYPCDGGVQVFVDAWDCRVPVVVDSGLVPVEILEAVDGWLDSDDTVNVGLWEYVKSGGNSELLPDLLEASRSGGFVPVGLMAELLESVEGDAEKGDLVVKLFKDVFAVVPVNDVEKSYLVAALFMLNDELKFGGFDKNVVREDFLQMLSQFKGFDAIADNLSPQL